MSTTLLSALAFFLQPISLFIFLKSQSIFTFARCLGNWHTKFSCSLEKPALFNLTAAYWLAQNNWHYNFIPVKIWCTQSSNYNLCVCTEVQNWFNSFCNAKDSLVKLLNSNWNCLLSAVCSFSFLFIICCYYCKQYSCWSLSEIPKYPQHSDLKASVLSQFTSHIKI